MGIDPSADQKAVESSIPCLETEPLSKNYDGIDPQHDSGRRPIERRMPWLRRFSGWRGGVLGAMITAASVLLLNIALAILISTNWTLENNIATAFSGNCRTAGSLTTAIHLLINVFSTLLLAASNYCMQRLVAPTRAEIDNAHAKKKWLDIGKPSVKNLLFIGKGRVVLWILLGLASLPLHFLYNSVVFEEVAGNNIHFLAVSPEFFTNATSWSYTLRWDGETTIFNSSTDNSITQLQLTLLDGKYQDPRLFENVTGPDCVRRYNTPFITDTGNGFGVPSAKVREKLQMGANNSMHMNITSSGGKPIDEFVGSEKVQFDYCLSEIIESRCKVQFSITILIIVIVCNVVKIALFVLVLWQLDHNTFVTIGDAIQSFLERPDPSTEDCCLMSQSNVKSLWKLPEIRMNQRWNQDRVQWSSACSRYRWAISMFLYIGAIAIAIVLLVIGDTKGITGNGFGKFNPQYLLDVPLPHTDSIIPYILMANLPQTIVSFIALAYNGQFTCMLANREWTQYGIKRAPLRVSVPNDGQRSTYFLQLPYIWGVPLLAASTLLHWLISQSVFFARIAVYENGVPVPHIEDSLAIAGNHQALSGNTLTSVGYSDMALEACIVWGSVLVVALLLIGYFRRYPAGIPIGGTCSAVVSAACHTRYQEDRKLEMHEDMVNRPVMWGVTIKGDSETVGHCCFSSGKVEPPRHGFLYAGKTKAKSE